MEKREQERVVAALKEILEMVDLAKVSMKVVRVKAAEMTGIDLSSREWREFVLNVIKKFMAETNADKSDAEADVPKMDHPRHEPIRYTAPISEEDVPRTTLIAEKDVPETAPAAEENSRKRSSNKMKETEEAKENDDQEYEDDEEEAGGDGKKPEYEKDDEGNTIICELSAKRKVVLSRWKGRTLISVREYYEKDGKTLPSSKGISLTGEQFEILAKSANNIEAAISSLQ